MKQLKGMVTLATIAVLCRISPASGQRTVIWSADMETGDLSQWYSPSTGRFGVYGGGEYNSGIASSSASTDVARSGLYSAKLTITTPNSPSSGVRLFRWTESRDYPQLYYSVWYYIPQAYSASVYWNLMQWKSSTDTVNDPFFLLNVRTGSDGQMYFQMRDEHNQVGYNQSLKTIPVEQWFQVEAFHACAGDNTGRVVFWQDGVKIFDVSGVQTQYADGDCQWSVNNYSSGLSPDTSTIYIDDAEISVGPPPDGIAPSVAITSPLFSETVAGTISVSASASDDTGIVAVQFQLDGDTLGTEMNTAPYSTDWDTTTASDGEHTLTAVARNSAGVQVTSEPVVINVDNSPVANLQKVFVVATR